MIKKIFLLVLIFSINQSAYAVTLSESLVLAYKNNPELNAERENFKVSKEDLKISRSEFLPSLTISGSQSSIETSNITDQSGTRSGNTKRNTETKKISVDQKIFQGFQGYNNFKKSRLEYEKAINEYKQVEQDTILNSVSASLNIF